MRSSKQLGGTVYEALFEGTSHKRFNAQYVSSNPPHIHGYCTCSFDTDITTSDYKETTQVFYSSQHGVNPLPWMILGFR